MGSFRVMTEKEKILLAPLLFSLKNPTQRIQRLHAPSYISLNLAIFKTNLPLARFQLIIWNN
ncbi:uncharacterized protein METZ01_LOCUS325662 [marine metagenome]|uniref:Uncharacterized protein n=1 Tax=marine metagenome TaxID=408172 RepID=A0A382PJF3_9ZZZZ